jgi:hypothetical protein
LTCSGPAATECDSCLTPKTISSNTCVCPDGYHDEEGTSRFCLACPRFCATCTNSSLVCSSCKGTAINYRDNTNECKCSDGFTDWGIDTQLDCVSLCDGDTVPNRNTGFNCRCLIGYFEDPTKIGDKSGNYFLFKNKKKLL